MKIPEYCCIRLKDLGLVPGEEVKIIEGVKVEFEPERVTVIREYPEYVLLDMEFMKSIFCSDLPPRHVRTAVTKGAMFCGDVKLLRLSEGIILCGEEVGHYEWI